MKVSDIEKARQLAEEHFTWLEVLLKRVFVDAFIHGYKHAKEEKNETTQSKPT